MSNVEKITMDCTEKFSDPKQVIAPRNLQDLINQLNDIFAEEKVNVEYVQEVLNRFEAKRKEWKPFEKFDPHRYTRNLVDTGNGKFNLILLCWGEGQGSGIHSHAGSHCFVKVMSGKLKEELYDWPEGDNPMQKVRDAHCSQGDVTYINDDLGLHRIENPCHSEPAISLHVYSPPFDMCQSFDEQTGRAVNSKVTFWSKYGERTPFKPSNCEKIEDCYGEPENN